MFANNRVVSSLFAALLLCFPARSTAASVHKIGPDLYAYISDNEASANSTFLVSDQGILVVDTGLSPQEGRKLLDEIRRVSQAPVRWIVNTHYHPDHRGGNNVVGPDAVIISLFWTRSQVLLEQQKQTTETGHKPPPEYWLNMTFRGKIALYVGGYEVQIYAPGPAHTMGDIVAYFPDQHAIATGDLFLTDSCPAMDHGDLENWIAALDQILFLPVDSIVPGHFALAGKKDLARFRNYLLELKRQVLSMYRNGFSVEDMKKSLSMKDFADMRQFPQYEATFADNAAAYYHQLEQRNAPRRVIP
jgi:cyclase